MEEITFRELQRLPIREIVIKLPLVVTVRGEPAFWLEEYKEEVRKVVDTITSNDISAMFIQGEKKVW